MSSSLPPYFHPTTVCFIDDNYAYLRSIDIGLPRDWSYIAFISPERALDYINRPNPLPPLVDRCFAMDNSNPSQPIIHLDLGALEQEIKLIDRFTHISVLLIDYAMPTMGGLEFAAAVKNKRIKKALLTGVADEATAVEAFNDGLIDRYIPKGRVPALRQVLPYIETLKAEYFEQYTARLRENLALDPPAFMVDPSIIKHFDSLVTEYNIVEYFLVTEPYGYLMLRADGSMFRLIIQSEREVAEQIQLAKQHDAPEYWQSRLINGEMIGYFFEHPANYLGHEVYPWEDALVPATRVEGNQTWTIGILQDPPADIDFNPSKSSYDVFLSEKRQTLILN